MLIGLISDTHDRLPMIDRGLTVFRDRGVQVLIHPGDFIAPFAVKPLVDFGKPIHATFGNNDGERAGLKKLLPDLVEGPLFVELAGRVILIHHFIDWCRPEDIERADIVLTGHTHQARVHEESGKLFVNPGECCGWVTGQCTVALLDTDGPSVEIVDLEATV